MAAQAPKNEPDLFKLVYRLSNETRPIVFLFGSGLTMPRKTGEKGVPGSTGVISLMRELAHGIALEQLEIALLRKPKNPYQTAFKCFARFASQDQMNGLVRYAVAQACLDNYELATIMSTRESDLINMERSPERWHLPAGVEELGDLLTRFGDRFANTVLTTNFDPLIEIGISKAGGQYFRTALSTDGNLLASDGTVPHVIHLHGYWRGTETLHTPTQLTRSRPLLENSLRTLLRDKTVVILGYGGWDDVFTRTLLDVIQGPHGCPEVVWAFLSDRPSVLKRHKKLVEALRAQLDIRVKLYFEIAIQDLLTLFHSAVVRDKSKEEQDSDLFWYLVENYIRWHIGDPAAASFYDAASPKLREMWRPHVERELRVTPELVKAIDLGLEGGYDYRTDVILATLRCRSVMMRNHPRDIVSKRGETDYSAVIRSMFLRAQHGDGSDTKKEPVPR